MKRLFSLALLSAFLALPAQAATVTGKDNLGRPRVSTEVAVRSILASGESSVAFSVPDWDLFFTFAASGQNDDSGADEQALLGFGAYLYVGENSAIGLQVSRPDLAVPEILSVSPKAKLYLFRDPFAARNQGVMFTPLSWNVATGENDQLQGGAFSVNPILTGFMEWPIGWGAITIDLGVEYVLTELSQDVPDSWGSLQGGFSLSWWFIR